MDNTTLKKGVRLLPVILIMVFILLPVAVVVWISFFKSQIILFPPAGYSLKWYANLANKPNFISGALLSLEVAAIAMVCSVIIGTMTSLALSQRRFKYRNLAQTFFLSPLVVPSVVTGIAIYVTLTYVEQMVSLNLVPTTPVLILGHVIITIPWTIRLVSSGLTGVNPLLEEAGLNLGANRFQAFVLIILPQLRPSIMAAAIMSFIISFGNLEISLMLIGPGQYLLPIETLNYVLWTLDPTIAALSTLQIVMVFILLLITDRIVGLSNMF